MNESIRNRWSFVVAAALSAISIGVSIGVAVWMTQSRNEPQFVSVRGGLGRADALTRFAYQSGLFLPNGRFQAPVMEPGVCRYASIITVDGPPPRSGDFAIVATAALSPLGIVIAQPVLFDRGENDSGTRWAMFWSWCNVSSATLTWDPGIWHYYAFH